MNEDIAIQLERDPKNKNMYVLHMMEIGNKNAPRTVPRGRVELRGKAGYEIGGYDPKDKLHQFLDAVGKGVNVSELINGSVAILADRNPRAKKGLEMARKLMSEDVAANSSASIPDPKQTAMGPRASFVRMYDKRRRKDKPPLLLKRFRRYTENG